MITVWLILLLISAEHKRWIVFFSASMQTNTYFTVGIVITEINIREKTFD